MRITSNRMAEGLVALYAKIVSPRILVHMRSMPKIKLELCLEVNPLDALTAMSIGCNTEQIEQVKAYRLSPLSTTPGRRYPEFTPKRVQHLSIPLLQRVFASLTNIHNDFS